MNALFIRLFNMSITASWLILVILLLRLIFQKAPKAIRIVLWSLVGLRLILPFSLESVLSLIPSAQTVSLQPAQEFVPVVPGSPALTSMPEAAVRPVIDSGFPFINEAVNPVLSRVQTTETSVDSVRNLLSVLTVIWLIGVAALLVYALLAYIRLHRKVSPALRLQGNIWISDYADTPFILGLIKPRIFLPSGLAEEQLPYVIAHEQAHLARKDHLWKPLGFVLLAVYWFNPLIWAAYYLFCRDIELACDERVIRSMSTPDKVAYSDALLENSVVRRSIMTCPLAFGAVSVKERVRSILSYKKPAFWVIVAAIAVAVVLAVCFLTDPKEEGVDDPSAPSLEEHELTQLTGVEETSDSTGDDLLPGLEGPALKAGDIYHSSRLVYQIPTISWYRKDSGLEYAITGNSIVIRDKGSDIVRAVITILDWKWQEIPYTEEEWGKLLMGYDYLQSPKLDSYGEKLYMTQNIAPDQADYHVLSMDGELWMVTFSELPELGRQVMDIFALQKVESADLRTEGPELKVGDKYAAVNPLYIDPDQARYLPPITYVSNGFDYLIAEDSISLLHRGTDTKAGSIPVPSWHWRKFPYSAAGWEKMFRQGGTENPLLNLDQYRTKLYLPLSSVSSEYQLYELFYMDGDIWLASVGESEEGRYFQEINHFVRAGLPLLQVATPAYRGKIDRKLESLIHLYIVDLYQNKELGTTFDLSKYIAGESLAGYLEKLISQQYQYIARSGFQRYNYLLGIEILEIEELAEDTAFVKLAVSLSYNSLGLDNYMSAGDIVNLIVSEHKGEYKVTDQYIVDGYYDALLRGPDFNLKTEYLSRGIGSLSEQELSAKDQEVKDKTADFTQLVFPRYQSEELKDSVDETVEETVITFTGKLYENKNFGQTHDLSPYLEGEMLEVFLAEKIRFSQFVNELAASKKFEAGQYLPDAPDRLTDKSYEIVGKLHHLELIENDIYLATVQVISRTQYPDGDWGGSSVQVDLLLSITGSEVKVIDCYEPNDVFDVYLRGNIDLKFDYRRNRYIQYLRKIDILTGSAQLFGNYAD